ncbi:MAG: metal ABC transporter ATP-binding protein [Desulfurococcales archaeon]|nr:metal ABC transporter ATP-binding protein [Desulfurococcales archaeon]
MKVEVRGKSACIVRNVTVKYGSNPHPALENVSFEASLGEMVMIAGPNGGGKSTLLKVIVGLVKPVKGNVKVLGRDPFKDPAIRRLIGYVPQITDLNLSAPLTLRDLVMLPRLAIKSSPWKGPRKEDIESVERSIKELGLEDHADKRISELSGGMLARALIARVLALDPILYVMDEPFESMDWESEEITMKVLRREKERGKLIIVSEHHISDDHIDYFDRTLLLKRRIIAEGRPRDVIEVYRRLGGS